MTDGENVRTGQGRELIGWFLLFLGAGALQLPALGRIAFEDAETGEIVEVGTGNARKRAAFAERRTRGQAELERMFRSAGIDAIQLRTDRPYTATLGRFFETREKRRRR